MLRLGTGWEACCQALPDQLGSAFWPVVVKMLFPANRSLSNPPKRNALFFRIAPPTVPPLNSSLLRSGPVNGMPADPALAGYRSRLPELVPGLFWCFCVLLIASV